MRSHLQHYLQRHRGFIAVTVLVLIAALPVLTYPMGRDQGMYANIGRTILNGGVPFVDMWDIKPPPIYYLYAASMALFGQTTAGVHALNFILVPLGMGGLYLLGNHLDTRPQGRRLGVIAALLYGVFIFNEDFPSITQNDSLVTVPMIWAAYAAFRAMPDDNTISWRWALVTGMLCGVILWFKHYLAFFVVALVINQIVSHLTTRAGGKATSSNLWADALAFAGGGLLTGGTLLAYFWSQGMWQEMLIIARSTAAYNAQGYDFSAFLQNMSHYFYFKWLVWSPLLVLAALWLPTRWLGGARARGWRLVILWWLAGVAFLLIQALGFDTHWIPMLPPLALFAADALDRIISTAGHYLPGSNEMTKILLYALPVLLLAGILTGTTWGRAWRYITGQETRIAYFDRFQANDVKPEQSLQMVQYLRERTTPGDTLFVYGFRPEVAFMADLRPATRYQAQFPLAAAWYPAAWRQHNVDVLWAAMPPYALVLENDYMPWVTGRSDDSHTILQDDTQLNNWLIANYQRIDQIGDFIIWRRQPQP